MILALYRDKVQRKFSIPSDEWERKTGKKLVDDKHHRRLTKEQMFAIKANYDQFKKFKEKRKMWTDWGEEEPVAVAPSIAPAIQHSNDFVPLGAIGAAILGTLPAKKPTMENPAGSFSGGGCCGGSSKEESSNGGGCGCH